MGITNVFTAGPVTINSTTLVQIDSFSVDPQVEQVMASAGGEPVPSFVASISVKPVLTFTTTQVAALLALVSPLTGLCFPTGTVKMYFTRKTKCAPRSAGTDHFSVTAASGLIVINRITCPKSGGPATAEFSVYAIDDGTNPILAYDTTENLPANVNVQELFTLGLQKINGTEIPDVQNLSIDFAPVVAHRMGSADTSPSFVSLDTITPKIKLDCLDATYLDTYALTGTAQTSSATAFYLQKLTKGAGRVAAATTAHVKFSLSSSQGQILPGPAAASGNSDATCQLLITPIGGASAIMTVATASAMS